MLIRMRIPTAYRIVFVMVFSIITRSSFAQNLVPNPGFEGHKTLPYTFSRSCKEFTDHVEKWTMPNEATSDYFHVKCGGRVKAKKNFAGVQDPFEGEAYAGVIVYTSPYSDYRE